MKSNWMQSIFFFIAKCLLFTSFALAQESIKINTSTNPVSTSKASEADPKNVVKSISFCSVTDAKGQIMDSNIEGVTVKRDCYGGFNEATMKTIDAYIMKRNVNGFEELIAAGKAVHLQKGMKVASVSGSCCAVRQQIGPETRP